jgi:undecaprenyl-diphosphatase
LDNLGGWLKIVVLGILQGLTEFLPVSSSGHLLLMRKLFGLTEGGLFLDVMLHVGTLAAIFTVFWKDIRQMIRRPFERFPMLIIVASIPTAIIGILFKSRVEFLAETGAIAGICFLFTGAILWIAENIKNRGWKQIWEISFVNALFIGILQGVAVLPAVSRSGSALAGCFLCEMERKTAAKFVFIMSIPPVLGAALLELKDVAEGGVTLPPAGVGGVLLGMLAAAVSGYAAIRWMLRIIQKGSLKIFSIYVWILGAGIIIAQVLHVF